MLTWIDIADTAVKIGLGALVAGGFGYLTMRLGHDREERARYAERRRVHLEKIFDLLVEVEHTYVMQKAYLEAYRFHTERHDQEKANAESRKFSSLDTRLYADLAKFTRASSVLLILGEKSCEAKLEQYRGAMDAWYSHSVLELDTFPEQKFNELRSAIINSRAAAFEQSAVAYRSA